MVRLLSVYQGERKIELIYDVHVLDDGSRLTLMRNKPLAVGDSFTHDKLILVVHEIHLAADESGEFDARVFVRHIKGDAPSGGYTGTTVEDARDIA